MRSTLHRLPHRLTPLIIRAWVILWILSVPLFHVHPELADPSSFDGAMRSGTVHTVFSGDLDGEFETHHAPPRHGNNSAAHLSHAWFEHSELGFSLLNDSHHRADMQPLLVQTLVLPRSEPATMRSYKRAVDHLPLISTSTLLEYECSSRAPPTLLM